MNVSVKLYTKAVKYYNEGYMEKALDYCEKSISENIKNAPAINLKGLLYYLRGELDNAQAFWKMNYQVNSDEVAKKYFEASRQDQDKKLLYLHSIEAIKALRIREALLLLEKCSESDFNSINVNNYTALCYIKLGQYNDALRHINLVFKIDKHNLSAHKSKKELISLGVIKKEFKYKYAASGAATLVLVLALLFLFKPIIKGSRVNESVSIKQSEQFKVASKPIEAKKESEQVYKETEDQFSDLQAEKALESKDYDKLYDMLMKWQGKELPINQRNLLANIKEFLSTSGVEYFYNKGRKALASKDYGNAIYFLNKSQSFGEDHYLNSHIIYLLAVSYKNTNDTENAIKYYKKYDSKYAKGDYHEAVLYDLSLLNKNIDSLAAKEYAKELSALYPKSIYNNSIIKGIASN